MSAKVVPIVIRVLGIVTNRLGQYLDEIKVTKRIGLNSISTDRVFRRVLDI